MTFSERWKSAFDARDRDAFDELIDDAFLYVRHQSGKDITKDRIIDIWCSEGPRPIRRDYRIVYENDEICVTHQFIDFPSGDKESVMVVMLLRNEKLIRMETGATPMPS
ncbi:MAG: nuclear transport factor 2 family protein [Dinoroseobacter sp.]|nr:nuclear transport factor 2 family protein [Dinoroseobacter sp.]